MCRFVDFSQDKNKFCGNTATGERYYCVPRVYDPMPSWLFHNNGDGTFTDVSKESDIAKYLGKAWGVVACDINNDGNMDLFVANDTVANFLLLNDGKGKFVDIGTEAGSRTARKVALDQAWASTPPTTMATDGRIFSSRMLIVKCILFTAIITTIHSTTRPCQPALERLRFL